MQIGNFIDVILVGRVYGADGAVRRHHPSKNYIYI